jgi:hypothetical protein
MPRPPTAACAAVLPIVVFEMAFSILSTPRKPGGNRGGPSGFAGSRRTPRQPRISALGHRPKVDPNASQRRKDRERFAISKLSSWQLSLRLSSGSGSPAQSFQAPPGGDARARFSQRAPRRATSLRSPACSLSRAWRDPSYPIAMEGVEGTRKALGDDRRREQAA